MHLPFRVPSEEKGPPRSRGVGAGMCPALGWGQGGQALTAGVAVGHRNPHELLREAAAQSLHQVRQRHRVSRAGAGGRRAAGPAGPSHRSPNGGLGTTCIPTSLPPKPLGLSPSVPQFRQNVPSKLLATQQSGKDETPANQAFACGNLPDSGLHHDESRDGRNFFKHRLKKIFF